MIFYVEQFLPDNVEQNWNPTWRYRLLDHNVEHVRNRIVDIHHQEYKSQGKLNEDSYWMHDLIDVRMLQNVEHDSCYIHNETPQQFVQ